jgi:hypothetical protein
LRFLGIGNYLVKKKALKVVSLRNAETNNC